MKRRERIVRHSRTFFPAMSTALSEIDSPPPALTVSRAFLPYPASTLSPPIIPTDLTSFKSRGISEVEREMQQKLIEIREQYIRAIDHFNWNKLVYEADIQFEPIIGRVYHLYEIRGRRVLSMVDPEEWPHRHLATLRLNVDRQWQVERVGEGVDPRSMFASVG